LVLLYGSIYEHFYFLETATCINRFFVVVRNNAVQYRSNVKWCHLPYFRPLCRFNTRVLANFYFRTRLQISKL